MRSRPWSEIVEFYRDLTEQHGWDMQPMVRLTETIATSRYATGVYPATSLATLFMAQHPEFEKDQNTLQVDFEEGRFIFVYSESPSFSDGTPRTTPTLSTPWNKECGRDAAFRTFEHVMRRLKWFVNL